MEIGDLKVRAEKIIIEQESIIVFDHGQKHHLATSAF